jgi:hypothetical protein
MKVWRYILRLNSDFKILFYRNEFRALRGLKSHTLLILSGILLLTFIAFGYAFGGLKNLKERTSDPYTNWIELKISGGHIANMVNDILTRYEEPEIAQKFNLDTITGWNYDSWDFYGATWGEERLDVFTVVPSSKLFHAILDPSNLCYREDDFLDIFEDGGIIISQSTLDELLYTNAIDSCSAVKYVLLNRDSTIVPLRIAAVVYELPAFASLACAPVLYNIINSKKLGDTFCGDYMRMAREHDYKFPFLIRLQDYSEDSVQQRIAGVLAGFQPELRESGRFSSGAQTWIMGDIFFPPSKAPSLDEMSAFFSATAYMYPAGEVELYDRCAISSTTGYHYIAFNFNRLNHLRSFQQDLKSQFGLSIDMRQIEDKENFALVSRLTSVILMVLLTFSIFSIVLFITNLLRNHLSKMQQNLGTFKAFGLSTSFLVRIYAKIVLAMLLLSMLISLGCVLILDGIESLWMREHSRFDIFNIWLVGIVIVIILITIWFVRRGAHAILKNTAGDLIYSRNK